MHCVDLGESFPTHIFLQTLASIQPSLPASQPAENEPCKVCPLSAYGSLLLLHVLLSLLLQIPQVSLVSRKSKESRDIPGDADAPAAETLPQKNSREGSRTQENVSPRVPPRPTELTLGSEDAQSVVPKLESALAGGFTGLSIQMPGPGKRQRKFRSPKFPFSRTF